MKQNIIIGGAWPYANSSLHLGHIAGLISGDVLARYYRLKGDNVLYVSGSDTHGTPITERARKEGIEPKEIAQKYHKEFTEMFKKLNFSYIYNIKCIWGVFYYDCFKQKKNKCNVISNNDGDICVFVQDGRKRNSRRRKKCNSYTCIK